MSQNQELDVLCVGDAYIDDFIKLVDENAWTYVDEHGQSVLAMPYGMKIPYDHSQLVAGIGNAANAAVSLARLGLKSGLISNVGDDDYGRKVIAALKDQHVDSRFVHLNPGKRTSYHYILWYKEDRTILIRHELYDYHWPRFRHVDIPKWIYLSSVAKNSLDYHDQIIDWLDHLPDVKLAFQPGTYQMQFGAERLQRIYRRSEVVVLNREEAVIVTGGDHENLHELLDKMHDLGPKVVVITDGPNGAYSSDGTTRLKMPLYPDPSPPKERTGAGDAFASTFMAALMRGETVETALLWAPINSMNVVQHVGAQEGLLSTDELQEYLKKAPDWYHPEQF